MKYYIDCEFDGHNGPLLSMAMVREDGDGMHIRTTNDAQDPWVIENVMTCIDEHDAPRKARLPEASLGAALRAFMHGDETPVLITDSPVDTARFCAALMTAPNGKYEPNSWASLTFEVHDVDCYPTTLANAVQHNSWWDAMALREKLSG